MYCYPKNILLLSWIKDLNNLILLKFVAFEKIYWHLLKPQKKMSHLITWKRYSLLVHKNKNLSAVLDILSFLLLLYYQKYSFKHLLLYPLPIISGLILLLLFYFLLSAVYNLEEIMFPIIQTAML